MKTVAVLRFFEKGTRKEYIKCSGSNCPSKASCARLDSKNKSDSFATCIVNGLDKCCLFVKDVSHD